MGKRKAHSLIDKVWRKVKENRGIAGTDGVTIEKYEENLEENLQGLRLLLKEGEYKPSPLKRAWVAAGSRKRRPLGIPAVKDRIVQQALLRVLTPIFEKIFLDCSYGFRPGRSCHQALSKVEEYLRQGYQWVADVDIKSCFDSINQKLLVDLVAEEVADGKVLKLIQKMLKGGVMEEMKIRGSITGIPQGANLSPLLANIYLHQMDKVLVERGYRLVRWADDFVIMCKTERKAKRAVEVVGKILSQKLRLKISQKKTRIVSLRKGFEFLGYLFTAKGKRPKDMAIKVLKSKIKNLTKRKRPIKLETVIKEINPVLRGWGNYFKKSHYFLLPGIENNGKKAGGFYILDFWVMWRIRNFIAKKWRHLETMAKYSEEVLRNRYGLVSLSRIASTDRYYSRYGMRVGEAVYGSVRTV